MKAAAKKAYGNDQHSREKSIGPRCRKCWWLFGGSPYREEGAKVMIADIFEDKIRKVSGEASKCDSC